MADSTHTLRLKATLDTTDVKQKLDQLRQAQKQAISGAQQNAMPGGGGVSGNIPMLTSTLQRLTATMTQMQQAISRLAISSGRPATSTNMPYLPVVARPKEYTKQAPAPRQYGKARDYLSEVVNAYKRQYESSILGWARRNMGRKSTIGMKRPLSDALDITTSYLKRINNADVAKAFNLNSDVAARLKHVRDSIAQDLGLQPGSNISRAQVSQAYFKPYTRRAANHLSRNMPSIYGAGQSRFKGNVKEILGFGIGHVLNPMAEYANATGNTALGTSMGVMSNVAIGAATGGMFGGPIGAGIGAGAALLGSAFEKLTERANALADAMKEQEDRVKSAKEVDRDLKRKLQDETDAKRLRVGDVGYFQGRIDFKKGLLSKLTKQQEEIGIAPGSLTAYEEETQRQIEAFREGSPTGELPDSIKRRQRLANRYKANISTIEQIKSDISGYEGNLESLGVLSEKKQDAKDFQENTKRQEQWRLVAMRDIYQKDYDEIDERKKALYREAEAKGTSVSLDKLEDLQDQLDALDEKLKVVNTELDRRAEDLKEQRSRERDDRIEHLQETLANMKAPNMQGISNLASYGMAGSLKDDQARLDTMVDYQKEQYRIQTEIRDLMREKKDEETPTVWG